MSKAGIIVELTVSLTQLGWDQKGEFFTYKGTRNGIYARCKLKGLSALFYTVEGPSCANFRHFYYRESGAAKKAVAHAIAMMSVQNDIPPSNLSAMEMVGSA